MTEVRATARIVEEGNGQMVLLPEHFRLPGREVEVSRSGRGLLLEPIEPVAPRQDVGALLAKLKRLAAEDEPFMPDGREQPPMPPDDDIDAMP